jgi:hypothetical protein
MFIASLNNESAGFTPALSMTMRGPPPVALRLKGASCPAQRDMRLYQRVDPLPPAGFLLLGHGGDRARSQTHGATAISAASVEKWPAGVPG